MKIDKIGTSIIFLNAMHQVLLFLRDDRPGLAFSNCWDLPGGMLEGSETPEETIKREMLEEIGVRLETPRLFRIYEMADRVEYSFWTRSDLDIDALTLHEGQGMKWFTEEDIRRMPEDRMAFNFKAVLLDFYRDRPR